MFANQVIKLLETSHHFFHPNSNPNDFSSVTLVLPSLTLFEEGEREEKEKIEEGDSFHYFYIHTNLHLKSYPNMNVLTFKRVILSIIIGVVFKRGKIVIFSSSSLSLSFFHLSSIFLFVQKRKREDWIFEPLVPLNLFSLSPLPSLSLFFLSLSLDRILLTCCKSICEGRMMWGVSQGRLKDEGRGRGRKKERERMRLKG